MTPCGTDMTHPSRQPVGRDDQRTTKVTVVWWLSGIPVTAPHSAGPSPQTGPPSHAHCVPPRDPAEALQQNRFNRYTE